MSVRGGHSGLGRGLSALLGEPPAALGEGSGAGRDGVKLIDIAAVRPNPAQPRRNFDEQSLIELAESIARSGLLQPILVRPVGDGYEIVAGERRWRAAQRARLHQIPALIRDFDSGQSAEVALIENIQREDLNAIEEAQGYRQLITRFGHSQEQVAALVHKSRSHVANLLRLLDLPEFVRNALLRGDISMGHARAIATSPDAEQIAREIIARGLSVRQTEQRVRSDRTPRSRRPQHAADGAADADIAALERQISDLLGLRVRIDHRPDGGTFRLEYASLDQLDMICQRLTGEPI